MKKINLAKSAGFCFGVKRAIDIAFATAKPGKKVQMLGQIVHNEDVIEQIKKSGIQKISSLSSGKDKTLLLRAHGAGASTIKKARQLGYKIVDATCPMVKEIHKIAKGWEEKGYKIIVVGDKRHDEVRGIIGQLKSKAIIIDTPKNVPLAKIKRLKKAALISQSTQNIENVQEIRGILKKHIKDLEFFNTICQPTRIKQQEIRALPLKNDVVIVIGSKKSANTRRLYEISKALNKKTYRVASKEELNPSWFKRAQNIGITAGASTPDWITQEIINSIKNLP